MAATDVMVGDEGTLYFCTIDDADESTVGAVWTMLGYVTGFSIKKNNNDRTIYNKTEKACNKRGRKEYTGSISQLYTTYNTGVYKLFNDGAAVSLKLEIDKDMNGVVDETWYFALVNFKNGSIDFGSLNENGDVTMSCEFDYADDHTI